MATIKEKRRGKEMRNSNEEGTLEVMVIQNEKWTGDRTCSAPSCARKEQNQGREPARLCSFLPATGPSELLRQIPGNGKRRSKKPARWDGDHVVLGGQTKKSGGRGPESSTDDDTAAGDAPLNVSRP